MHWEEKWAAPRIHGRTKRQVQAMFEEEKPYLKNLALMPFRFFRQEKRTVWDDGMVQVGQCYYAALPAPLFSDVWVKIYDLEIEILNPETMMILRRHRLGSKPGDMAFVESDRIFNPSRETDRLLTQAAAIGVFTSKICQELFKQNGRVAQKKIQGIIALSRKHAASYIEAACQSAFERHAWSSRAVRFLIEQRIAEEKVEAAKPRQLELIQVHESIRPISEYQSFWDIHAQMTADVAPGATIV